MAKYWLGVDDVGRLRNVIDQPIRAITYAHRHTDLQGRP